MVGGARDGMNIPRRLAMFCLRRWRGCGTSSRGLYSASLAARSTVDYTPGEPDVTAFEVASEVKPSEYHTVGNEQGQRLENVD